MTEKTPSFLDINIDEAMDLTTIPDDTEVELRIRHAEITPNKNDPTRFNLALTFEDPSDPTVDDIKLWLPIPDSALKESDPKRYNRQLLRYRDFFNCFGIDPNHRVQPSEMIGLTGYCVVGESEDPQYGLQNYIKKFIVEHS